MNESEGTNERLFGSSGDFETLRVRAWPCASCRQGVTTISHLIGCQRADSAFRTASVDEKINREVEWLRGWIERCPHNHKYFPVVDLTHGSEHQVYLDQQFRECVVKCTLPGLYGDKYFLKEDQVWQQSCTPYEYLVRLRLWRKIFGFAPQDVGMLESGQIVSIHEFVAGEKPSQVEVNEFLRQSGLTAVRESCWLWKIDDLSKPISIWVGDARDDNFVVHEGMIIPIDLRLWITPRENT